MKVTVLTPLKQKAGKAPAAIGSVVEIDEEEAKELAAVGAVQLPPPEPEKPAKEK
jgi:hypothetical protein